MRLLCAIGEGLGVEVIARVKSRIAQVLKHRAVELVAAALGDDVDRRAAVASVLRRRLRLQIELLDGVNRQQAGRCSGNAHLVQRRVVEEGIVVVRAVQQVVVAAVAVAVDVELAEALLSAGHAAAFHGHAGSQRHQLAEVASVQRQVNDQFVLDHLRERARRGVQLVDRGLHLDRLLDLLQLAQGKVDRRFGAHVHLHRLPRQLQPRSNGRHLVVAGRQLVDGVAAVTGRGHRASLAGLHVTRRHGDPGQRVAAGVLDLATQPAAVALRAERDRQAQHKQ